MDDEKLNKPNDIDKCVSRYIGINLKTSKSNTKINDLPSTSSIKPKKSCSLLSALVRRTKLRSKKLNKKVNELQQIDNLKFITSNSTMGSQCSTDEFELTLEKIKCANGESTKEKNKLCEISESEHSLPSSVKIKHRFFSKLLKKHVIIDNHKKKLTNVYAIESNEKQEDDTIEELEDNLLKNEVNKTLEPIVTSFVPQEKPALNSSLMQGLVTVQNLASRLQQSEAHLIQMFTKYITDISMQKELIDTLCLHSKLHLETERMNNILSMEMWLKQLELEKLQESSLQEALNSVVRQNRQLQTEYEILFCSYEKLLKRIKTNNDQKSVVGCEFDFQDIIKHNVRLTEKTELLYQQIERLENELTDFRKQNESLENQLSTATVNIHDLEVVFHKTVENYELELSALKHQINLKQTIIVNVVGSCQNLKTNLESYQDDFKEIKFTTNWKSMRCTDEDLTDFIECSRLFIIDIIKELTTYRSQITKKNKEMDILLETNSKLQENLKKSSTELDFLGKQIEDSDKILNEHRYKCLEADIKIKEEKLERLKMEFEFEKNNLLRKISEFENILNERNFVIERSNTYINNLNCENNDLRKQINDMNKVLQDSGSGDIIRQLHVNQEHLHKYQFVNNQLLHEKQQISDQLTLLTEDLRRITESKENYFKQIQNLQTNLDNLTKENQLIHQKYETERHTVISLQTERKKYLEEKALIKTFFHHMKTEINRLQKLENAVTEISKEANKLAVAAEYNEQLGKKLKSEIQEKDKTIIKLRSSVEQLNNIQLKNTKEKLSLCHELTEICQIKEKLNCELSWEMKRNVALDEAKNEITENANTQIQQYENFHKKERTVLKDLLKDLKCVVKQRNHFLAEKSNYQQEIEILQNLKVKQTHQIEDQKKYIEEQRQQIEEQQKNIQELHIKLDEKHKKNLEQQKRSNEFKTHVEVLLTERKEIEVRLKNFEEQQEADKNIVTKLKDKLVNEIESYDEKSKQMEKFIMELRKEKINMEDSIKYLQNNTQKLHKDLNLSRETEKNLRDSLNETLLQKSSLESVIQDKDKEILSLNKEKQELTAELHQINAFCEKVLADFQDNMNTSVKKEELFKTEINEFQKVLYNLTTENKILTEELSSLKTEFETISTEVSNLKENEKKCEETILSFESQKNAIKEILNHKEKIESNLNSLKNDYNMTKEDLRKARQECESLYRQLKILVEKHQFEDLHNKKEIAKLAERNKELEEIKNQEITNMQTTIQEITEKLERERLSYTTLSQMHKEVSTKFINSIKDIADQKNSNEETERELKESTQYIEQLIVEKEELREQLKDVLNRLDENKNHISELMKDKDICQEMLTDLQRRYNEILKKSIILEDQLRETHLKESQIEELKLIKKENEKIKRDFQDTHNIILSLQKEIGQLQQEITLLEFQRSESILKLHELQRKFETEQNLCRQLKNIQKIVLNEILKMKEIGNVDQEQCNCLIDIIKNESISETEEAEDLC